MVRSHLPLMVKFSWPSTTLAQDFRRVKAIILEPFQVRFADERTALGQEVIFVILEAKAGHAVDLVAKLLEEVIGESVLGIAVEELVNYGSPRKALQDGLIHGDLVEIGVEKGLDDWFHKQTPESARSLAIAFFGPLLKFYAVARSRRIVFLPERPTDGREPNASRPQLYH